MDVAAVTLKSSLAEIGRLGAFVWFLGRGLRAELTAHRTVVDTQEQTLEAMERRVKEAEKVSALYRKLIDELPGDIDKYKKAIRTGPIPTRNAPGVCTKGKWSCSNANALRSELERPSTFYQ